MTDVITEERGVRIHSFIPDGTPAIVYIRKEGTMRVKRSLDPVADAVRQIAALTPPTQF